MELLKVNCSVCHQEVDINAYFCPNCGNKLKEPALSISLAKQILIYTLSIIFPLGLSLTIKYLKSNDEKAKKIGRISVIITIITIILSIILSVNIVNNINEQVNKQMNLQNLGF